MISVKVTSDFEFPTSGQIKEASEAWIEQAQEIAKDAILDKTAQGLDADGVLMPPYSDSWARTRSANKLRIDKRYLRFSHTLENAVDSLMNNIVSMDNKLTVTDIVMDKAEGNNARAEFFAVGDDTLDDIEEQATEEFMRDLGLL